MPEIIRDAIDFARIAREADLFSLVTAEFGESNGRSRFRCGFHQGEGFNFEVYRGADGSWRWRCHSACDDGGTAIDFVMRRDGHQDPLKAARTLDGSTDSNQARTPRQARPIAPPLPPPPAPSEDPAWQAEISRLVDFAAENLRSPAGRDARRWLADRGIPATTAERWRLGFLAEPYRTAPLDILPLRNGRIDSGWLPAGITIPWLRMGSFHSTHSSPDSEPGHRWVGVNCRRLAADPFDPLPDGVRKYAKIAGSRGGSIFPHGELLPSQAAPCLIVEGEWDSILGDLHLSHLVSVVTVGSATQSPTPEALENLRLCNPWLILPDDDNDGDQFAASWLSRSNGRGILLDFPTGCNDLTDLWRKLEADQPGMDLAGWLKAQARRLVESGRWPSPLPV